MLLYHTSMRVFLYNSLVVNILYTIGTRLSRFDEGSIALLVEMVLLFEILGNDALFWCDWDDSFLLLSYNVIEFFTRNSES